MENHEQHHPEGEQAMEKARAFDAQQAIMKKIEELGFARYAEALPDLAGAFDLERHKPAENMHRCLCCMDERTPYGLHSAGSGILLPDEEFDALFEKAGLDSISSHDGCGAGKLYCQRMGLDVNDSDRIAREWAERKAKEKGVPHIHLPVDKPFHYARVCYYDGTGRFNYKGAAGLPAGFVVGRKFMSEKASLGEDSVAGSIIFGDHGLGGFLTEKDPFMFIAVGETPEDVEVLKAELAKLENPFGKKVVIDGFVAPKR